MAYIYGSPVTGKDFYGRKELLDELVQFNPTETYFLNGIRRIGKSSVLKEVERRTNEQGYLSIYLDLLGKTTPKEHGEDLGRIIENRLETAQMPYNELDWVDIPLNKCISKWANFCRKNGKKSFVLIDEAEKIHELSTLEIENLIRNIQGTKDVLQIILTGTFKFFKLPENRSDLVEFQAILQQKYIGCLSQNEIKNIVQKTQGTGGDDTLPDTGINIDEADFSKLWLACGGHPFLVQFICAEYFDTKNNQFRPFPNKLIPNQQLNNIFKNDFELFNEIQQRLLRYLPTTSQIAISVSFDYSSEISELKLIGIITSAEENKYRYYGHLFETWMRENQVKKRVYIVCANEDAHNFRTLEKFLKPNILAGKLEMNWADSLGFGNLVANIETELAVAHVCIFMLSPNTLANERIIQIEMGLVSKYQDELKIVPLYLTPSLESLFNGLGYIFEGKQKLPKAKDYVQTEEDWAEIANEIIKFINNF